MAAIGDVAPLFSMSLGSAGTGDPRFSVWYPVTLSPALAIRAGSETLADGLPTLRVRTEDGLTVFELHQFDAPDEALGAIEALRGALMLWGLEKRSGLILPSEVQQIAFLDQPAPGIGNPGFGGICEKAGWQTVEGHYEADKPAVVPQHRRLIRFAMGNPRVTMSTDTQRVARDLGELLRLPGIGRLQKNEKLSLAAESYLATQFPISPRAQFLEMVAVLEIIAPSRSLSPDSESVLSRLLQSAKAERDVYDRPSGKWADIERLVNRLGNLNKESIKENLRQFARSISRRLDGMNAEEAAATIASIYDRRSLLVHEGRWTEAELRADLAWLNHFVPSTLALLMRDDAIAA